MKFFLQEFALSLTSVNNVLTRELENAANNGQVEAVKSELRTGRCHINAKDEV